ncbi:DUF937 domain-containing protein [Streptomyces sp. NPDC051940]|uniref:DUF937 domain-containing protein n=1 Tax=Streptomyces sp. NPDC051940 TaxID=3155675 RepID=UPI0034476DB9
MTDKAVHKAVLDQLGSDQMHQLASELGTNDRTVRILVDETVSSLSGTLADEAQTPQGAHEVAQAFNEVPYDGSAVPVNVRPLSGVSAFAGSGALKSGVAGAVLARVAMPVARTVAKRTGLPVTQVEKALRILLPLAMTALSQAAKRKNVKASGLSEYLTAEQQQARPSSGLLATLTRLLNGGKPAAQDRDAA